MTINDCRIIELPKFLDARGNLSFAQNFTQIPFEVKRTYWLYDVPGGVNRGGHAEINNEELIIALSGAFDIVVDDGKERKTFTLNRSYYGLYVKSGMWRTLEDFSSGAVCMVLASDVYKASDYIRSYDEFVQFRKENGK